MPVLALGCQSPLGVGNGLVSPIDMTGASKGWIWSLAPLVDSWHVTPFSDTACKCYPKQRLVTAVLPIKQQALLLSH